jgi:hypothetical protein
MSDVQLTINQSIVTPIVESKIKEAIIEALGGTQTLIEKVVNQILTQSVNSEGKVSTSSYDNKYKWLDVMVTQTIKTAAEQEIRNQLTSASKEIKEAIIKQLQTKKGSDLAARAILDGLSNAFKGNWKSKIDITLSPNNDR